jgi:DNA-binding transcriptional ArsR family regulator
VTASSDEPRRTPGSFSVVPIGSALDGRLSKGALRTLVVLCSYADETGVAWPSQQTLADRLGAYRRSVRAWLAELEDGGYIERRLERRPRGGERTVYRILYETTDGAHTPPTEASGVGHG